MKVLAFLNQSTPERGPKAEPPVPAEAKAEARPAAVEEPARRGPAVEVTLSPLAHQLLGNGPAAPRPAAPGDGRLSGPYGRLGQAVVPGRTR